MTRARIPAPAATCAVCGREFPLPGLRDHGSVRPGISALIAADHPGWGPGQHVCLQDLGRYRRAYVEDLLEEERGELTRLDREVLDSLETHSIVATDPEREAGAGLTPGEWLADAVADVGGSWGFIGAFATVLVGWMVLNVTGAFGGGFDPYPFILLNLVLSCLAAVQAPIIMMSQRRQETKDRLRAMNDYRVNLKAELEIRLLHEKIDHQWMRLAELQRLQIEALADRNPRD